MNAEMMLAARKARRLQRSAWTPPRQEKGKK
ncbi:hypothetical protein SEA_KIPPER29_93 [Mycobacterium phage Kipper29]|uniref:Uncharacterized protein n=6 Tax=Caudoviricetes TaxID=2731619 RepID=A0A2U8UQD5_9CAUD|nr:hypothetical protein AXJ19_gp019 [Mycobacterium phage VohminGhazi]YP_010061218.1 hypothetical protein KIP54_gp18 [Mycobacterium phage JewelBug]YP_010061317.1 hypothetical protein KIP55_gp017 [Mycobacterium phage Priamo]AEK08534.1 hypothetical protein PBI_DAVINCI_91 [Mycobacterium phage DaVinci]AMQ66927.1 hypothetical protein PBI_MCFLY_93 [Mycobacterium phage McFly]AMW64442.1 hypothetical protein PBI_KAZAN_94 [Mycobacterium phage Kazan]AVP42221.1 hypothetical protein SEA_SUPERAWESOME_93 [My